MKPPFSRNRRSSLFAATALLASTIACSPATSAELATELLWPDGAPGALGDDPRDKPTLTVFLPEQQKAGGAAVVVCPGGGYGTAVVDREGYRIARWLNTLGVAGFVLDYRHRGRGYGHPAPLDDAQRAIRTVRARADEWKLDADKIGIMGFSAGGHLASTAGTHFDGGRPDARDPIERVGCRPDFLILCYAVIAFEEPYSHRGSQNNLLGANADPDLVRSLSSEKQVTAETPPTFLFQTDEDTVVPAEHSVAFYLALRQAKVPAELHIYRTGPHGVDLADGILGTANWTRQCADWMRGHELIGR